MDSETFSFRTGGEDRVLDITSDCEKFASGRGGGLLHVFVPHATAGIAIIETGAGSDDDLLAALGTCCRPTTAGDIGTVHPVTAGPT